MAPGGCTGLIDFVYVIDVSGSVRNDIGKMRAFASLVMRQFTLGEAAARFGLVKFSTSGSLVVPLTADEQELQSGIDSLRAGGWTCLQCGFEQAAVAFNRATPRAESSQVVLLLTDGNPNKPAPASVAEQSAITEADSLKASGVTIFAWGFGGVDYEVLTKVATQPAAVHAYKITDFTAITALVEKARAPSSAARAHSTVRAHRDERLVAPMITRDAHM